MTWRELMKFIEDQNPNSLDHEVKVYVQGESLGHSAVITEVLEDGWVPYLEINNTEE